MLAVADWWLAIGCEVLGVVAAAAAPAAITVRAKIRMASFIIGNLWWIWIDRKHTPVHQNRRRFCKLNPANSEI
jgi:hypothetical protein